MSQRPDGIPTVPSQDRANQTKNTPKTPKKEIPKTPVREKSKVDATPPGAKPSIETAVTTSSNKTRSGRVTKQPTWLSDNTK